MRAEVRELEAACGEEERADRPCGSATSSDSNSNGDVKGKKKQQNGVAASPNGRAAKQPPTPTSGENTSGLENVSPGWTEVQNQRAKKFSVKQSKRLAAMTRPKRKSGGADRREEHPIEDNNHHPPALSSDDSDNEDGSSAVPGPSTSSDIDFGYEPSQVVPWATKAYYPLSIDGLHEEIVDCWQWLKPTRLETAVRNNVYDRVRHLIEYYWYPVPVRVSVFGSLRTRLFLPSSDIDVLVECDEWLNYSDHKMRHDVMNKTLMCLQIHLEKVSFHPAAFVPIIKLVDPDTRLNIDISFNTVQGVKAATYMSQVKTEFPALEPLLLLLKQYIFQNKLHEAYSGGLSSYGISLMLVNFFQIHHPSYRRRQPEGDGVNLGYLLMRFFEVYGHELNYSAVAIDPSINRYRKRASECPRPSVAASGGASEADADVNGALDADDAPVAVAPPTEADEMRDSKMKKNPILLSVHDPLQEGNEVCRSSFNIYSVRTLFQSALVQLRTVFVCDRPGSLVWRSRVYKGTMLGRLLHFAPSQINFRYWLKGFVLSRRETDNETPPVKTANGKLIVYGSLLSDPSDMTPLANVPKSGQRALEIKRPDDHSSSSNDRREEERRMAAAAAAVEMGTRREEMMEQPMAESWEPQQTRRAGGGGESTARGGRNGGGGQGYGSGNGYYNGQSYQREWRNGGGGRSYHQSQHYQQQPQQQLQPVQQPQPFAGTYQSKTWERPTTGGYGRRFDDHRNKSRSSEMLSELRPSSTSYTNSSAHRPGRQNSPLITYSSSQQQYPQQVQQQPAAASVAATMAYKRSDSAVSSCSTTVLGGSGSSAFTSASSSVSSPTIADGFSSTTTPSTTTMTTSTASSAATAASSNGTAAAAAPAAAAARVVCSGGGVKGEEGASTARGDESTSTGTGTSDPVLFFLVPPPWPVRPGAHRANERPLRAVHAARSTQGCRGCSCKWRSRGSSSSQEEGLVCICIDGSCCRQA